jgi:hypothetical protein
MQDKVGEDSHHDAHPPREGSDDSDDVFGRAAFFMSRHESFLLK